MPQTNIEIPVKVDSVIFQEFSLFDTFRLRKRWVRPALFAAIMAGFACICFAMNRSGNQGALLGGVLLAVGVVLPGVYVFNYLSSVKAQIKKMGLEKPHRVYTVILGEDAVTQRTPTDPPQTATLPWAKLYGAWRTENAIYLYTDAAHALLLPNGQANAKDEAVWACLQAHLGAGKCHDLKKR